MPKRHRRRTMKGGFLDDLSNTLTGLGTSISEGASSIWEKTKNATTSLTSSTSSPPPPAYPSLPMSTSTYGGKRSRRRRSMRGGFKDNSPTGLVDTAEPISGVKTAQPHNWVGGKTRRRRRTKVKSRRYR